MHFNKKGSDLKIPCDYKICVVLCLWYQCSMMFINNNNNYRPRQSITGISVLLLSLEKYIECFFHLILHCRPTILITNVNI